MTAMYKLTVTPPKVVRPTVRYGGGSGGGGATVVEQPLPARATQGNFEPLSEVAIARTPVGAVTVRVNGIVYGADASAWVFARGASLQLVAADAIEAGDVCIWRGADIGFDIEPDDDVVLVYEVRG